jgi:hypothetical protein
MWLEFGVARSPGNMKVSFQTARQGAPMASATHFENPNEGQIVEYKELANKGKTSAENLKVK